MRRSRNVIPAAVKKKTRAFQVESFGNLPKGETKMLLKVFREEDIVIDGVPNAEATIVESVLGGSRIFMQHDFVAEEIIIDEGRAAAVKAEIAAEEARKKGKKNAQPEPEPEPEVPAIDPAIIEEYEARIADLEQQLAGANLQIPSLQKAIDEATAALPKEKEASRKEGYEAGKQDGIKEATKAYDVEKNHYLGGLQATYTEAKKELEGIHDTLNKLDEQLPELVVGLVQDIIGIERKINDRIVVSVIKQNLDRVRELENVVFLVHPHDVAVTQEAFPDYGVTADSAIKQGSVKIRSKVGDIDISIEGLMENLETLINEELEAAQEAEAE